MTSLASSTASIPSASAIERTSYPIVTGSSVLGIKYADGVMVAADTLCSYGSMAKFKDARRIKSVGENTLVGAGGEYSDFEHIMEKLETLNQNDINANDGHTKAPSEVFCYLRAILYERRNKMNPLWNDLIVAGHRQGKTFLGFVDKIGTCYEDDMIATGFGAHLALPILRNKWRADLDEGEARALLEDCLRVLFYRDCRALDRVQIAKATKDGTSISEPFKIETSWDSASFVEVKGGLDGDGGW